MVNQIEFGTGGFRGVIGDDFIKENIVLVAQGLSDLIKDENSKKPVVIGYDYRFISDEAARWMGEVFAANGISVLLSKEPTPTPAVMYLSKKMDNDYGVMITASHNPYTFNGIKVFQKEGMDADVQLTNKIEKFIRKVDSIQTIRFDQAIREKKIQIVSFLDDYVDSVLEWISDSVKGNKISILFDNLYGVGIRSIGKLIKTLRLPNVTILHRRHDAFFGFELPNPKKDMMERDVKYIQRKHYDFAFGIDSDGDRLGVLDENGKYVDNNEILSALYYYMVRYKGLSGDSVKNCATSNLLDCVTKKLGYKCHEVDVGFKNISSKMKETNALLGGESSGGLTARGYLFGKDSTFSFALFLEMVVVMGKPVSEIINEVRDFADFHYTVLEGSIDYHDGNAVMNFLKHEEFDFPDKVVEKRVFGRNYKFIFENNQWALLRCSGTEPTLRIFVEMETKEKADRYFVLLKDKLSKIDRGDL